MKVEKMPLGTAQAPVFVVVFSFDRDGALLLSRHRDRSTWETQGGHIEAGETPMDAAGRELYEESGAVKYALRPLFDYRVGEACGVVFAARVEELGPMPESEMAQVQRFAALPENLTYPDITPALYAWMRCTVSP